MKKTREFDHESLTISICFTSEILNARDPASGSVFPLRYKKDFAPYTLRVLTQSAQALCFRSTHRQRPPNGRSLSMCGPERTRTPYLLSANEALYQVSYRPIFIKGSVLFLKEKSKYFSTFI
jgi:hypothetical protein